MGGKSRAGSTCSLPGGRLIRWLGVRIALCKRGLARTHMLVSMLLPLVASVEAPAYTLPAELLAKAHALERLHTVLYFGGTVWELVVLALLLRWGVGARLAKWARGLAMRRGGGPFTTRPWLEGLLVAPVWLLTLALIALPGSLFAHSVRVRFGLSVEHWAPWWWDWAREEVLSLVIGTLLLSALFALLRWSARRWWLWLWLLVQPFVVLGVFLAPVAIDPLFNRFTPLVADDPALVTRLQQVAKLGGLDIPANRIFLEDASRRDTGMNAYVTGIGSSKRIVVWDTTIAKVPTEEILAIYAHEQGHYVLGHIWEGIAFEGVITLVLFALLARLLRWSVERFHDRWHVSGVTDWAALPVLLFLASCLSFLSAPVSNGISRMEEHAADVYGQRLLSRLLPNAAQIEVDDFNRLGRAWLEDPSPSRLVVWWTYTHPPVADRAEEARRMGRGESPL